MNQKSIWIASLVLLTVACQPISNDLPVSDDLISFDQHTAPDRPDNFTATHISGCNVELTWGTNNHSLNDYEGVRVYLVDGDDDIFLVQDEYFVNRYLHTSLDAGTYVYKAIAFDYFGNDSLPATATVTVSGGPGTPCDVTPPAPPANVQVSASTSGLCHVDISWSTPSPSDPDYEGVRAYVYDNGEWRLLGTTMDPNTQVTYGRIPPNGAQIRAVAFDYVGNESAPVSTTITLPPANVPPRHPCDFEAPKVLYIWPRTTKFCLEPPCLIDLEIHVDVASDFEALELRTALASFGNNFMNADVIGRWTTIPNCIIPTSPYHINRCRLIVKDYEVAAGQTRYWATSEDTLGNKYTYQRNITYRNYYNANTTTSPLPNTSGFGTAVDADAGGILVGFQSTDYFGTNHSPGIVIRLDGTTESLPTHPYLLSQQVNNNLHVALDGDLAVFASPNWDHPQGWVSNGIALLYEFSGGSWSGPAALFGGISERFGYSVEAHSGRVIIGAPGSLPTSQRTGGAAYIFEKDASGIWQSTLLVSPQASTGDAFGNAVALFEDYAVVGAPGEGGSGRVHLFQYDAQTSLWNHTTDWGMFANGSSPSGARFGSAVSISRIDARSDIYHILTGAPNYDHNGVVDSGAVLHDAYSTFVNGINHVQAHYPTQTHNYPHLGIDVDIEQSPNQSYLNFIAGTRHGYVLAGRIGPNSWNFMSQYYQPQTGDTSYGRAVAIAEPSTLDILTEVTPSFVVGSPFTPPTDAGAGSGAITIYDPVAGP